MDDGLISLHIPTRPFGVIDAINRRAACTGSLRYAALTAHANYNGHHYTVSWNSYRRYYVTEYFWAGRIVVARTSDLAEALRVAVDYYDRGDLGAAVAVAAKPEDVAALPSDLRKRLTDGPEPKGEPAWYSAWIETCLARHCDHHIVDVDKLDLTDAQKSEELQRRVFPTVPRRTA